MKLLRFDTRNYALLILSYLQTWIPLTLANGTSICDTSECNLLAKYYWTNLNHQGNACSNFYDYVCHGWINQNPKPIDKETWNVHELMLERSRTDIKKLLDDPQVSQEKEYEQVKTIYRSCLKIPIMEKADAAVVRGLMSTVGNWPMFPANTKKNTHFHWQSIENQYINIAGDSAFFKYYLTDTGEYDFQMRLVIERPRSAYGALKRFITWIYRNERKAYKSFLHHVVKSVAPYDTINIVNVTDSELEKVIDFRDELRRTIDTVHREYDTMSIGKLISWYASSVPQQGPTQIDWLGLIRHMYNDSGDSYGNPVTPATIVKIQPDYILQLSALLSRTPETVIANHIHLYFAERHTHLTYEMQVPLLKSFTPDQTGSVLIESKRWEMCLQGNNTATNLRRMYIRAYFPPPLALTISQLFENTRNLLIKKIENSSWADSMLKQKWKETIKNVRIQKGFPTWYLKHMKYMKTEPKHTHDVDPLQPMIHYLRDINRISYSVALFRWPFYNLYLPDVVLYGSVVPIIGHEFYHALGYKVLLADIQNSSNPRASAMYQQLQERTQCFKDQYDYYRNEDIKNRDLQPGPYLAETTTEDIPDVMGLKLAYEIYKKLKGNNRRCTVPRRFQKFGCDKMFFISYANGFCASTDRDVDSQRMRYDVHSLTETRVNRAVANNREFAKVFGCQQPQNTCDLWQ